MPVPNNCTFKVGNDTVADSDKYSNTECKSVNAEWNLGNEKYSTVFLVHVLEPQYRLTGTTIYYGEDANLKPTVDGWQCADHSNATTPAPSSNAPDLTALYRYSNSSGAVILEDMTDCKEKVYASVNLGKEVRSLNKVDVHVLKPTISAEDHTLYWTQSRDLNACMSIEDLWKCDQTNHVEAQLGPVPAIDFTFKLGESVVTNETVVLDDCTTYDVTATINGLDFPLDRNNNSVTVHVVKPVISCADTAIYLGNSVDLNAQMTEDPAWKCTTATCPGHVTLAVKDNADNRVAPALDHKFSTGAEEVVYKPDNCTHVTVTSTIQTGSVSRNVTPTQNTFTVHVYVPQFTVTTQDLWADCGSKVPLYDTTKAVDAIVNIAYPANKWVDRKADYNTAPTAGAQEIADIAIQFSSPNPIGSMGETDVDVNVNSLTCKVNGVDYTAVKTGSTEDTDKQLMVKPVDDTGHDFTVHVNKFKAVITNNGTQNAIYTLSNGTKVAVEAGKSTTVAGLICGKDYEISEANNDWTWRYASEATTTDKVACTVGSVKSEPTNSSIDVAMNYGNMTNAKWLAGEDYVINKLDPKTQKPVVIPEDRRKKEGADA